MEAFEQIVEYEDENNLYYFPYKEGLEKIKKENDLRTDCYFWIDTGNG